MMLRGVDVSRYQSPAAMPWGHLREAGFTFAIVKASDGVRRDPVLLQHVRLARDAGFTVGAYHFFRQHVPAAAQLDAFLSAMDAIGYGPGWIVPALDIEQGPTSDGPPRPELFACAEPIALSLRCVAGECLIYGGVGFLSAIGKPDWWLDFPLWVAHYTKASEPLTPGGAPWRIWQHASAPIAGIYSAKLDQNIAPEPLPLVS